MKLFFFAGEASGDLHGSHLIQNLKDPLIQIFGVGGAKMEAQGLKSIIPIEEFQIMGFTEIVSQFPKLWKHFRTVRTHILETHPDAVILIDYPGFNLRLAKSLRKHGYQKKIIQYISPTVWAWGKKRIEKMAKTLDLLLLIFPFEERYFEGKLAVKYVGHPLVHTVQQHLYDEQWKQKCKIPSNKQLIALFPGSRPNEVSKHLQIQLAAARKVLHHFPNRLVALSCMHDELISIIQEKANFFSFELEKNLFLIPSQYTYELMRDSHSAIAKSGTITLELALHQRPTVVMYAANEINRFLAQYIFKINLPYFCIVNVLAQREVFPELIKKRPTPDNLMEAFLALEENSSDCIKGCQEVISSLGSLDASREAAANILEILS